MMDAARALDLRSGNKSKKTSGPQEKNIQVVVRCRPRNASEKKMGSSSVIDTNTRKGEVVVRHELHDKTTTKTFTFDRVYGPESNQIEVYKGVVEPIISEVLLGYNCTVFAYGQTGTGKTYTMEGERCPEGALSWEEDPLAGIIPRSLHQLFQQLECQDSEFSVRVSFLELYNEELFDLLSNTNEQVRLRIFDDSARKGSVVVQGLEELTVHSKDEVYAILEKGRQRKQMAATLMNAHSSRSHTVFSVTVHTKESSLEGEELLKTGKLNLVDLAGSENIGRSGADNKRAKEAGSINQSLLTLGRCITALVEKCPHIPYRESKLTRILQDSLGGRTKTSIVATITPAQCNLEETLSTLDYAHRAKNITNRPEINQKLTKRALIKEYTGEIERLKKDLIATREKNGIFISPENYIGMETKIRTQHETIVELEDKIKSCTEEIIKLEEMFSDSQQELEEKHKLLVETSHNLQETQCSLALTQQNLELTERERDETKFLINEHVKTEQVLLGQAEQLITTVASAVEDVEGLHNKIDRKTNVETSNKESTKHFEKTCTDNVESMKNGLQELKSIQTTFTQTLLNNIKQWSVSQSQHIRHLQQLISNIQSTINRSCQQQIVVMKERLAYNTEQLQQISNGQFQIELNTICNSLLVTELSPLFSELTQAVSQRTAHYQMSLESLKQQVLNYEQFVSQYETHQVSQLKDLDKKLKETSLQQSHDMDTLCSQMDNVLSEQDTAHKDIFADLSKQFNQWLLNAQTQLTQQWTTKMEEVKQQIQCHNLQRQQQTTALQKSVDDVMCDVQEFKVSSHNTMDSTIDHIDNLLTTNNDDEVMEKNLLTKVQSTLDTGLSSIEQRTNDYHTTLTQNTSNLMTSLEEQSNITSATLMSHCGDVVTLSDNTHTQLSTLLSEGVMGTTHVWQEMLTGHNSQINEGLDKRNMELSHLGDIATSFVSNELKEDIPTGMTPQRRQFTYPCVLNQTKPHPQLLKEFWAKLDQVVEESTEISSCDMTAQSHDISEYSTGSATSPEKEEEMQENKMIIKKTKSKTKLKTSGRPLQTVNKN